MNKLLFLVFFLAAAVFAEDDHDHDHEEECAPGQALTEAVPPLAGQCDWYSEVCCQQVDAGETSVEETSVEDPCANGDNTACADKISLLTCMICKPGVEIMDNRYVVCPSFADELYDACKDMKYGADCKTQTREDFDAMWFGNFSGRVVKEDDHCFGASNLILPSFFLALIALVF